MRGDNRGVSIGCSGKSVFKYLADACVHPCKYLTVFMSVLSRIYFFTPIVKETHYHVCILPRCDDIEFQIFFLQRCDIIEF